MVRVHTGLGEDDAATEAWYRPRRVPLQQALQGRGVWLDDVDVVVDCHLHFDHCGGNPLLAGQSHDRASEWSADALAADAVGLGHAEPLPAAPVWMARLLTFDPSRVVFAHDAAVWEVG